MAKVKGKNRQTSCWENEMVKIKMTWGIKEEVKGEKIRGPKKQKQ